MRGWNNRSTTPALTTEAVITEIVTAIIAGDVNGSTDIPAVVSECYKPASRGSAHFYERKNNDIIASVRRNTK